MKAKTKIIILLLISILSVEVMRAQSHRFNLQPIDSLPCVVQDSAYLYFPGSHKVFDNLYAKLTTLLSKGQQRINVLHIGGSHVQAGYLSGRMRSNLVNRGHVLRLERHEAPAVTRIQLFDHLRDVFFLRAKFGEVDRHADGMQERCIPTLLMALLAIFLLCRAI